jgi:hypothetical protein
MIHHFLLPTWENRMSWYRSHFTSVFGAAVCLAGSLSFAGLAAAAPPDFAPDASIGWYSYNRQFIPPPSGAGPVRQDPTRPYVSNDEFRVSGKQPTEQLADLNNPILQPWAKEVVRKRNEVVLAGKAAPTPWASCWPSGVLAFLLRPMTQPLYFVQGPTRVAMILASHPEVRHVYLTDKHSPNLKPSWYGESIGRYEGDSLVVDTTGIDDRTPIDGFGTPHTSELHVVERFHLIEEGKGLEATVHVEDPGAFTMPWDGIQRYRQYEAAVRKMPIERLTQLASAPEGPLHELICAQNPNSFFAGTVAAPIPRATTADF